MRATLRDARDDPVTTLPTGVGKATASRVRHPTFGAAGDPKRADCVFRNINGVDIDSWTMFRAR